MFVIITGYDSCRYIFVAFIVAASNSVIKHMYINNEKIRAVSNTVKAGRKPIMLTGKTGYYTIQLIKESDYNKCTTKYARVRASK